jgi:hypothetical protein
MGRELIGNLFWIAVGIFFALSVVKLPLGTLHAPGPAALPLCMALILILVSLLDLVKALRQPNRPISGIIWKRPAFVLGSIFLYSVLFLFIGFLPSTFILMLILFGLLIRPKKNKWPIAIACSAAAALLVWLVFDVVLRIPFPQHFW